MSGGQLLGAGLGVAGAADDLIEGPAAPVISLSGISPIDIIKKQLDDANVGYSGKAYTLANFVAPLAIPGVGEEVEGGRLAEGLENRIADTIGTDALDAAKSCLNSFTADTPVLMANGKAQQIAKVRLGERVLAGDPTTGAVRARPVVALIRHSGVHAMVRLTLSDGSTVDTTSGHPFWDATTRSFTPAEDLNVRDRVLEANGKTLVLSAKREYRQDLTAYNLQIKGIHTYFVGTSPVLVHNSCGGAGPVQVGQTGESIIRANFNIGSKFYTSIGGRDRIFDGRTATAVSEVKNTARQAFTSQLRDYLTYAQQTGRQLDIYTRVGTRISGPLARAAADPNIPLNVIKFLP